ncbi:MAG: hypothetical protein ACRENP_25725 [Longimicrobiales bacterium]
MCLLAVVLAVACSRAPADTAPSDAAVLQAITAQAAAYGAPVVRDLERVRAATSAFRDITAAQAVGYPTTVPPCLQDSTEGGMGHHYVDRQRVDDKLEVEHPEILLYAPLKDGKQKLVAVEYIIPLARWQQEQPPTFFGQTLRRSEPLQLWYLHVWAWDQNRAGLFADWNPAIRC